MLAQPSEIGVQVVFIKAAADAQDIGCGMHLSQAHGGEARSLIQHAGQDLPESEPAGEVGTESGVDAQVASGLKECPDGTDGGTLEDLDLVERGEDGEVALVLEGEFDGGDFAGIAMGEVGDIAFADAGAVAEGLAEVDGSVGFAVGGGPSGAGDIHVHII